VDVEAVVLEQIQVMEVKEEMVDLDQVVAVVVLLTMEQEVLEVKEETV
jgi:hypothetical protein